MIKNLILTAKGFLMGLANLVPGISGGTLALTLGIYEQFISALGNFFKNFKENLKFLLPIGIGILLSLLTLTRVIDFGLQNHLFITIMLFVGAIIGGLPMLVQKASGEKPGIAHILTFILSAALVLSLAFFAGENEVSFEGMDFFGYVALFFVGIVSSLTMIIPGISGSAVLMTIGYYEPTIQTIKNLTEPDLMLSSALILIPFGLGVVGGMLGGAKFIEMLIKKYPYKAYWGVVGFVIASIISIIYQNFFVDGQLIPIGGTELAIGLVVCVLASILAYKFAEK